MPYIGRGPGFGVRSRFIYTATANQTSFSGNDGAGITLAYTDTLYLDVYQNGVLLVPATDYTSTTGTSVVLEVGASADDTVEMVVYDIFSVADAVSAKDGGTFSGTIAAAGYSSSTAGTSNYIAGVNAGNSITAGGNFNVTVGDEAGTAITTGDSNTALGYQAGDAITTGGNNTALGKSALGSLTTSSSNTAIGNDALILLTEGAENVAVGKNALETDTKGWRSVAIGKNALGTQNFTSATDVYNVAVGHAAGLSISTGKLNTFVGGLAGDATDDGANNTAVGYLALSANCGDQNTALGRSALQAVTGQQNTAIGYGAGSGVTTGSNNIIIGRAADGASGASHNITIGDNIAGADNDFSFGKASNIVSNDFDADANWSRSSDERLKKNITNQTLGLDFINDLRTVKYNWKPSNELNSTDSQLAHLYKENAADNEMNTSVVMHNFIAQEVKAALDTAGVSEFGGWKEDKYGVQQVSREMFVIPLVKALQELSEKNDALESRLAALEAK